MTKNERDRRRKESVAGLPDGTRIFVPKIPIRVYFGGPRNRKYWLIDIFYDYSVCFTVIWYIYGHFVYFIAVGSFVVIWNIYPSPFLVYATRNNLAILVSQQQDRHRHHQCDQKVFEKETKI
jgi:hypothetical protein